MANLERLTKRVKKIEEWLGLKPNINQREKEYVPRTKLILCLSQMTWIPHSDDFDLQKGIWLIRHKPECPTRNGLGWSPKWGKERSIKLLPEAINFLKQLSERPEVYGQVGIGENAYWKKANFVFTIQKKIMIEGSIQDKFVGVRDFRTAWYNLRCKAGLPDLQVKDLRTFFNWLLGTKSDLSNKELGCYIGNTERVNLDHYTPYSLESSNEKLKRFGLSLWIPGLTE